MWRDQVRTKLKIYLFLLFTFTSVKSFCQESIQFERYGLKYNTLAGHRWKFEIPIELGHTLTSDYEFESTDAKSPSYLGMGFKFILRNNSHRGIGLGMSLDYSTNKYFRLNTMIDLDFLYQIGMDMSERTYFIASMFNKIVISKIIANVNDVQIQEYYFRINIFQFQFNRIAFSMGFYKGLFRNKYYPYFADKGLNYSLFYILSK